MFRIVFGNNEGLSLKGGGKVCFSMRDLEHGVSCCKVLIAQGLFVGWLLLFPGPGKHILLSEIHIKGVEDSFFPLYLFWVGKWLILQRHCLKLFFCGKFSK